MLLKFESGDISKKIVIDILFIELSTHLYREYIIIKNHLYNQRTTAYPHNGSLYILSDTRTQSFHQRHNRFHHFCKDLVHIDYVLRMIICLNTWKKLYP